MRIHEYQARDILRAAGIPVPPGRVIEREDAAAEAFAGATGGAGRAVIKAQVHAGGRGKAGFVRLVDSAKAASDAAAFMLRNRMKSPQTPPEGLAVSKLLIAGAVEIAHEFYVAITTDRATRRNVLIASREGGVEIEKVAHDRPEAILREPLHPLLGLQGFQARKVAYALGLKGTQVAQGADVLMRLARVFIDRDCTLAEINPLVLTPPSPEHPDGRIVAIDAKFTFDDNGMFRQKDIAVLADPSEENAAEIRANEHGLSYIALDGNIGCLVNGAGLAMATMDVIKLHGGEPANFLDVGGSASEEAVTEAFSIILSDARVKGVMVNIFGGIMRCDVIAQGIINAAKGYRNADGSLGFKVPLVVRLEGTEVEAGRALLRDARASIPTMEAATDLGDAARKVCAAVAGAERRA